MSLRLRLFRSYALLVILFLFIGRRGSGAVITRTGR